MKRRTMAVGVLVVAALVLAAAGPITRQEFDQLTGDLLAVRTACATLRYEVVVLAARVAQLELGKELQQEKTRVVDDAPRVRKIRLGNLPSAAIFASWTNLQQEAWWKKVEGRLFVGNGIVKAVSSRPIKNRSSYWSAEDKYLVEVEVLYTKVLKRMNVREQKDLHGRVLKTIPYVTKRRVSAGRESYHLNTSDANVVRMKEGMRVSFRGRLVRAHMTGNIQIWLSDTKFGRAK